MAKSYSKSLPLESVSKTQSLVQQTFISDDEYRDFNQFVRQKIRDIFYTKDDLFNNLPIKYQYLKCCLEETNIEEKEKIKNLFVNDIQNYINKKIDYPNTIKPHKIYDLNGLILFLNERYHDHLIITLGEISIDPYERQSENSETDPKRPNPFERIGELREQKLRSITSFSSFNSTQSHNTTSTDQNNAMFSGLTGINSSSMPSLRTLIPASITRPTEGESTRLKSSDDKSNLMA